MTFLKFFLGIAFILGPLANNRFILQSQIYSHLHIPAFLCAFFCLVFKWSFLSFIWFGYCIYGVIAFIVKNKSNLFSINTTLGLIPLVFSNTAAVWFVAGSNDFQMLGYNVNWSYYAALHGNFLGWIFTACLVYLAQKEFHLSYKFGGIFILISFLMIALGIDGVPYLKRLGLLSLTVLIPMYILIFILNTKSPSKIYAIISFLGILITMGFAIGHEFSILSTDTFLGARSMITIHGSINALISIPMFYIAIVKNEF